MPAPDLYRDHILSPNRLVDAKLPGSEKSPHAIGVFSVDTPLWSPVLRAYGKHGTASKAAERSPGYRESTVRGSVETFRTFLHSGFTAIRI